MDELIDLLLDPALPRILRLRANFLLANNEEDWSLAEDYRKEAERMYDEIRRLLPPGTGHEATEKKLNSLRESMDELAEDQELADPRQSSVNDTEMQLASEPKRSASPGRSASRESAHNAPEPERSVAIEPSLSPLAEVSENAEGRSASSECADSDAAGARPDASEAEVGAREELPDTSQDADSSSDAASDQVRDVCSC